jgi:hypothetical protein
MASSVDAKILKSTKFPPEFNQKVDMQKVNVEVMKKCVTSLREWAEMKLTMCAADGLQARYPRFLVMRMTL